MNNFHWIIDGLFVLTVALIWFMLGYQSLLFFLGHIYYRRTRHAAKNLPVIADADLPCVSVLVPCHNEERVIAHTVGALQKLDYPPDKVEFLLINDGSTDSTALKSSADSPPTREYVCWKYLPLLVPAANPAPSISRCRTPGIR